MSQDLTTTLTPSRPVSLFSASNEYLTDVLTGRCDQERLTDALRQLMGHFYQPNETPQMRMLLIADFVRDLADMSDEAVSWAIREWRRTHDRRPSPASLRQLCMMRRHEADAAFKARRPREVGPQMWNPATPEQLAERKGAMDRIARSAGFVRDASGQLAFPPKPEDAPKRIPHWSETAAPDDPRWAELRRARAMNTTPEAAA